MNEKLNPEKDFHHETELATSLIAGVHQKEKENSFRLKIPEITLSKGGGAIKSIDEKIQVNPSNEPIAFSLSYN